MTEPGNRPDEKQIGMSARQSIVLLILMFLAPLLIAWLMLYGGRGLIPEGTTNHGTLVEPPRSIELQAGIATPGGGSLANDYLRGKWTLVYIGDGECGEICLQNIYKMRQARLAQNENVRRVQRLFLLNATGVPPALAGVLEKYPGMDVALLTPAQSAAIGSLFAIDGASAVTAGRVYLVDPLGYLMMYYAPDAEPKGMLKDLQKLLKYSRIG